MLTGDRRFHCALFGADAESWEPLVGCYKSARVTALPRVPTFRTHVESLVELLRSDVMNMFKMGQIRFVTTLIHG